MAMRLSAKYLYVICVGIHRNDEHKIIHGIQWGAIEAPVKNRGFIIN